MDLLATILVEQALIYGSVILLCIGTVYWYLQKLKKNSEITQVKINAAKAEGRFEPVSLHPYIDLSTCIGSGACVAACPEKDILGLINGKAAVINATNCVGHGACFHQCPVEAISLRIGTETRGVELPHVAATYETNVGGVFIAGELGGMGLIKNSVEQGAMAVENIVKSNRTGNAEMLDLIIVGAGPAGISGALTAKKHGLNFKVLEQDTLGGTVYSFPRTKIVMTNPMNLPLYGQVKLFDTSKKELLDLWNDALSKNEIEITENTKVDRIIPQEDQSFKIITAINEEYYTQNVLIAIGRRGTPRKLGIPGEDLQKVSYRLLEPEELNDKEIIVVGGGDSAIEAALLLMEQNNVFLSYRKDAFARIKAKNQEKIESAINLGRLKVLYSSNLVSINEDSVLIKESNKDDVSKIKNDLVYIFIGGELPTKFLQNAGVEIRKRFGYVVKKHK